MREGERHFTNSQNGRGRHSRSFGLPRSVSLWSFPPPFSYSQFSHLADPDTGESALHVAVSLNHEGIVLQLLELGASIGTQDKEGLSAVMTACRYGHLQSLEQLATRGLTETRENAASFSERGRSPGRELATSLHDLRYVLYIRCTMETPHQFISDLSHTEDEK